MTTDRRPMKDREIRKSVADSLEMDTGLLPFVPELLKGMWALGSSPELVVELLRPLGLDPAGAKLLDLGCGKGAVAVTVAHALGFHAEGIDACESFLKEARRKAVEWGVSHRCRFELGDIREYVDKASGFDVVVFASLGGLLGDFRELMARLRRTVRPGGYILIDDGFLKGKSRVERAGYGHYAQHDRTLEQLTAHGDSLVTERLTVEENRTINREYLAVIKRNAGALLRDKPELEDRVGEYIRGQEAECEVLDARITGAIWLLRREETTPAV
jgi:ubiquinone/menaquinone biosynthesis C-methylase UbiE